MSEKIRKFWQNPNIKFLKFKSFLEKNVILELCKGMHCVDLGESFQTHILNYFLENFGFDTAENEPCKICPLSAYRFLRCASAWNSPLVASMTWTRSRLRSKSCESPKRSLCTRWCSSHFCAAGQWVVFFRFGSGCVFPS